MGFCGIWVESSGAAYELLDKLLFCNDSYWPDQSIEY